MSFKPTLTFAALAMSLSMGMALAAELPMNVKSIAAHVNGDAITVLWSQLPGAVSYRIYFSHESILKNGGNYDDFQQTPDMQTVYVFKNAPLKSDKIYFGVLAVDKSGNESDGFEVETSIQTSSQSSESSVAAMPAGESPTSTAIPMGIESVQAITETGILVTFTKELDAGSIVNSNYFLIMTASGTVLPAGKTTVNGKQVLIVTNLQTPDTEYILRLLSTIPATDGTNATPTEPQVRFRSPTKNQAPVSGKQYGRNPNLPSSVNLNGDRQASKPTNSSKPDKSTLPASGIGLLGIAVVSAAGAVKRLHNRPRK